MRISHPPKPNFSQLSTKSPKCNVLKSLQLEAIILQSTTPRGKSATLYQYILKRYITNGLTPKVHSFLRS